MSLMFNLMRAAVDYAGLFPPAGLPLDQVVSNYATYLKAGERAMLGRLVVPALKLSAFEQAAAHHLPSDDSSSPWRISALVPPIKQQSGALNTGDFDLALTTIDSFNKKHLTEGDVGAVVDAVEINTPSAEVTEATLQRLPAGLSAFLEVPCQSDPDPLIRCIAENRNGKRVFAKLRTGGVTPDLIPTIADVARFIFACATHHIGFKATAGLHHPVRAEYCLTYAEDSPRALMHGFLNVFIAAAFAFEHSVSQDVLIDILSNESVEQFVFADHKLTWGDQEISAESIATVRDSGIMSFGSCSFVEPVRELLQIPNVSYKSVFVG